MLATVLRWMLLALITAFVVLVVTGLYLTWNYRPTGAYTWAKLMNIDPERFPGTLRSAHQISAQVFLASGLAVAGLATALTVQRRRVSPALIGVGFFVAALAASFTGALLRWDQLGLRAVTVADYKGFAPIISGDQIRFAIVDGREISPGTLTRWFFTHEIVVPLVLIALAVALFRITAARSTDVEAVPEAE